MRWGYGWLIVWELVQEAERKKGIQDRVQRESEVREREGLRSATGRAREMRARNLAKGWAMRWGHDGPIRMRNPSLYSATLVSYQGVSVSSTAEQHMAVGDIRLNKGYSA